MCSRISRISQRRKAKAMTQDFFLGQLRLIGAAVIAYLIGNGTLSTGDGTLIGAVSAPALLIFGPWIWSVYSNVNSKLVPKNSVAISANDVTNSQTAVSSGVALIPKDSVRVVG